MGSTAQVISKEEAIQNITIHQSMDIIIIKENINLAVSLVHIAVKIKFLRIVQNDPFFMLS